MVMVRNCIAEIVGIGAESGDFFSGSLGSVRLPSEWGLSEMAQATATKMQQTLKNIGIER